VHVRPLVVAVHAVEPVPTFVKTALPPFAVTPTDPVAVEMYWPRRTDELASVLALGILSDAVPLTVEPAPMPTLVEVPGAVGAEVPPPLHAATPMPISTNRERRRLRTFMLSRASFNST
jgi:hypothetical protein